jgi:hypothetical protein
VFKCCEGDLRDLFWRYSVYELKKAIELKIGETYASHMTQFTVIAEVVSGAFGGKKEDKKKPTEDISQASPEIWQARMSQLFAGNI